jgi:hypothetical protein
LLAFSKNARRVIPVLLAIALTPTVIYYRASKSDRETIVFFGSVFGGLLALYTLVLGVEQYEAGVEQSKRQLAHHLIERWNDTEMETQKDVLRAAFGGTLKPEDFARDKKPNFAANAVDYRKREKWEKQRSQIVAILSFCEEVALSVNTGSANEDLIRRWMELILLQTFAKFAGWMEGETRFIMQGSPVEVNGEIHLEVYEELEKAVRRWTKAKKPGETNGVSRKDLVTRILEEKTA